MRPRARRAESHVTADRCKIEIDKSCWRQQLINLKARHGGTLPDDEVKKLYTEFSCPFGCFPPVMKPEEFLNMQVNLMSCAGFANTNPNNNHTRARAARASRSRVSRVSRVSQPVPRPTMPAAGQHYLPFSDCYGKPTPFVVPPLGDGAEKEHAAASGLLGKDNVRALIKCTTCPRARCVYMKANPSRAKLDDGRTVEAALADWLVDAEATYTCGSDLGEARGGRGMRASLASRA